MSKLWLLFSAILMLQASRACNDNNEEELVAARQQESVEYLANAYGFAPNPWDSPYYYQQSRIPEYASPYEGRTPLNRQQPSLNPFKNYFNKNNVNGEGNTPEGRFGISALGASIINAGLFNNRFSSSGTTLNRPFAGLSNRFPISLNPNFASPISTFDSCTSPSGESGICSPGAVCSLFGGRPSGSCVLGGVCCINAITTCGGTVTLNNTYWQSPTTAVTSPSTCALTLKLDTKLVEQKKPICQVRLDFIAFSIGLPGTTTVGTLGTCTDSFQVGGAINKVPTICGENGGQHMYLEVPSSATKATDLQLMLNFASGVTTTRSWNIKISMLPCGASYLAPTDCLQYFTSTSGKVSSFNWKDLASARQLNGQDYSICFRTELIDSLQKANTICMSRCSATNASPFSLSSEATSSSTPAASCVNDFLIFVGGTAGAATADRYCGEELNPAAAANTDSITGSLCSTIKPFRLIYKTNDNEPTADATNAGFCLSFAQSYV